MDEADPLKTSTVIVQASRLDPGLKLPSRAKHGDAGFDLLSSIDVTLKPGERRVIPTGLALAIPEGYAGYVQPRSGLAAEHGLGLLNSPGLIDSGYRGEIRVIAINLDRDEAIEVRRGERIAQMVILQVPDVRLVETVDLPGSPRGLDGFGSTGR